MVSSSGNDLTLDIRFGLTGYFTLTTTKVYLWIVDNAGAGTGWVQTSTWPLGTPQPPTLPSSSPSSAAALQSTFSFTGRDPNGAQDIYRMYFVVNPTPATPQNRCHGFYDRPSNAFYLYNDALTTVTGPLAPGSPGTLQNSQCTIFGTGSSAATISLTDLAVSIRIGLQGSFATTNKNVYVWIVDNASTGTGWLQTSVWNLVPAYTPSLFSSNPPSTGFSPETFNFVGRDPNGATDINRMYFLVNATPATVPNGCHGFYDRASNSFYLYNDALTVPMGPLAAGSGGTLANNQCTLYGSGSVQISSSGTDLNVNIRIGLNNSFATTNESVYLWITDNGGLGTGWIETSRWSTKLKNLRDCLTLTNNAVCTLPPDATPYTLDSPIQISRSNVTLQGGGGVRTDTKFVRKPSYTGHLIDVDPAVAISGVKIQNLTVCGSAKEIWNQNAPRGFITLPVSPVGCPRVQTVCGDMISGRTMAQQDPAPIGVLQSADLSCVDVWIGNVSLGNPPADNVFNYQGPYALEINNVDLEDSTGHALALWTTQGSKKVNDVYIHHSEINYSELTGILYGTNGIRYHDAYCDGYKAATGMEFRNDLGLYASRNIRIESNIFRENNTGAMGGGAMRWIGLRNNTFIKNYIYPQDGNNAGGPVEFDPCADKIEISNNTFQGPLTLPQTEALELYSRNTEITGNNRIYDYGNHGIVAASMIDSKIIGNDIKGNGWAVSTGAVTVANSFEGGGCANSPRDTYNMEIGGNFSNSVPAPAFPSSQAFGVDIQQYSYYSPGRIKNLTVSSSNSLQYYDAGVRLANFVELINYNASGGWPFVVTTETPDPPNPKVLPVDVTPEPALWPPVPRCRCVDPPPPPKPNMSSWGISCWHHEW